MIKKILSISFILLSLLLITSCSDRPSGEPGGICKDGIHENVEWIVVNDSTCTTLGSKEQRCKTCKAVITTAIISYKEHTEKVVLGTAPTCTVNGYTDSKVCKECNKVLEEAKVIAAINHNYVIDEESSANTLVVYKCLNCGDSYEKEVEVTNPCSNGHESGEWIETKESTCKENGSAHKLCINCGIETEVKSLPLKEHTEVKVDALHKHKSQSTRHNL